MKRVITFLLAILLLCSCMVIPTAAAEYDYEQGKAVIKTFPAVWLLHFEPTDITGAVAIEFDFFIDDADNFRLSAMEFGSHYKNDWQEIQYTGTAKWPKLNDGWNTVTFQLKDGSSVADVDAKDGTSGAFDPKTFQRLRIFNTTSGDPTVTYGIRNIVAVMENGDKIPVGSVCQNPGQIDEQEPMLDLTVQPGSNETALNFNWIATKQPQNVYVEIALNGEDFESTKQVFNGTSELVGITQIVGNDIAGRYACRVTASGLKPSRMYRYRVGYDSYLSDFYTIATQDPYTTSAYILSDIHVIEHPTWGEKLQVSVDNWQTTLNQLVERDEANLILSIGDQMQDTTNTDYLDGFFGIDNLTNYIFAPINGNHDLSPASRNPSLYTNVPNVVYPGSKGISDYYFKSGNVLFIMLSITDINYDEVDHAKTFEQAIAAYPDYDWMVVTMHEAIYGYYIKGYTADSGDILDYCNEFYGKFIDIIDKYSPDLVLTGHSHSYMRSHFMKNGCVMDSEMDETGTFVSPKGTIYINMGTSSRMWQFGNQDPTPNWPDWAYVAFSIHGHASYTYALLQTDGGTLTMEVRDNLEPDTVLDRFSIQKELKEKTPSVTPTDTPTDTPIDEATPTPSSTAAPTEAPQQNGSQPLIIVLCVLAGVVIGVAVCFVFLKKKK